jgi:protein-S-isoprenylcysteine O-methyltransferase Ste14
MLRSAFVLIVQLLPCVLLISQGWGFDDLPAFFMNPARSGFAAIVLAAALAAIFLKIDLHLLRKGPAATGNQNMQLAVLLILSLSLLWFLPFADRRKILTFNHGCWRYVGLLLCFVGVAVRISALKALGEYFSAYVTLQPDHRLVQHGIYSSLRHPLYLSLILAPAGIALVFASWLAFPILVLAVIFVFERMRMEECLLAAHFGSEFEDYRRRTRKLIPSVL